MDGDQISYYKDLGASGVGDAYLVIADNIVNTERADLGEDSLWRNKALMAGSTPQNMMYAHKLMNEAERRPKGYPTRKMLLEEARERLNIAIRNSLRMVSYDDVSYERRRKDLDTIDESLVEIYVLLKE